MAKKRLDVLLFEKGLCESRERAKTTIMSGVVFVDGQRADKPGTPVSEDSDIEVRGAALEYVSRGGLKLEKALREFDVRPEGRICIDCGASTGGFTDCLLKGGAAKVYAVDVGYGQLAWSIRSDPRVVVMERTNIRYVTHEQIPDSPSLAVIDVSFISLKLVLPVVRKLLADSGEVLCLIKPQFEAGREKVGKKGVVREASTHIEVLKSFMEYAAESGFGVLGLTFSPIKGPEGNIEYLGYLRVGAQSCVPDAETVVEKSHMELSAI
jgi:23S rRNA (cytidine1920-2'-O)/16S rRNA (cytidine1409-2'-O)-methyltransferase